MPYGTHKLLGAANTAAAWKDWRAIQSWCEQNGRSELAAQHAPKEGAGHKTVDKGIEKVRLALGAPAGAWEHVLDGLTPAQIQTPAEPKVRNVAWIPDDQLEAWDVPAAYARIRAENRQREQQPQPQPPVDDDPFGAEGLTAEQRLLNVAQSVMRHTEVKRSSNGRGRCQTYAGNVDQIALSARHLAEDITAYLQQRQMSPAEQYEYHLRQLAALKYPQEERTAEMTARTEATIQRKLGEFRQEQEMIRQRQQTQAPPARNQAKGHRTLS